MTWALTAFTMMMASVAGPAAAAPGERTTTAVTVRTGDGLDLGATVLLPPDTGRPVPGLVLVHGSGNSRRKSVTPEAEGFVRQGIAVLIYDKRPMELPEYGTLADDVLRAVDVLRHHPGVDPAAVGLWGISEGGWVAPLAAVRSPDVAFVVLASASGFTPIRTQNWNMRNKLRSAGVSGALLDTLSTRTYRVADDAGMFAEAHHDPLPALAGLTRPVLALYGDRDTQVPPAESASVLRRTITAPLTVRVLPGYGHTLRVLDGTGDLTDALADGYAEAVGTWVAAVAAGRTPASHADPLPVQADDSVPLTGVGWWESWPAQLVALGLLLVAFLAYPLVAAIRRVRRRTVPVTRSARVLSVVGPVTVLGAVAYLVSVVDSADWQGVDPGPLVAGRPLLWLVLQGTAAVTVVAGALTVHGWRKAAGDRVRLGVLLTGTALFLPWALYWGLLLP
jgi:pimeloyl-ACP methyl ester carboxylesterase